MCHGNSIQNRNNLRLDLDRLDRRIQSNSMWRSSCQGHDAAIRKRVNPRKCALTRLVTSVIYVRNRDSWWEMRKPSFFGPCFTVCATVSSWLCVALYTTLCIQVSIFPPDVAQRAVVSVVLLLTIKRHCWQLSDIDDMNVTAADN